MDHYHSFSIASYMYAYYESAFDIAVEPGRIRGGTGSAQ